MNRQKTMPHSKTKDGSVRTIREVGMDRWKLHAGVCDGYLNTSVGTSRYKWVFTFLLSTKDLVILQK